MPRQAKKRKYGSRNNPTAKVRGATIDKLTFDFPLDQEKIAAIQRCLAKGKLTITVSEVDFGSDRLRAAWQAYD